MTKQVPEDVSRVKTWDIGTRLFHWVLVICVVAAWCLGQFGPNVMTLHFYFGCAVIALLVFRIVWGLVGPAPARFSNFLFSPGPTLRYMATLKDRKPSYWPGHNPVGALSVFALLATLVVKVSTGLFADPDDYVNVGPLASMVDSETNRTATQIHNLFALVILLLVLLHVEAIAFYKFYKGENLVRSMITGWKLVKKNRA